jgi:hypothetical protein
VQQSDLDALSGCKTLEGTLQISTGFSGNARLPDSLQTITGGLISDFTSAISVTASSLRQLGTNPSASSQSLSIQNSMSLSGANFPQLTNIGGNLVLVNNSQLTNIDGFQSLQMVGGNIDLTGDFNQVSLPSLTNVGGGVNIQTSSKNFTCPISNDRTNGVIQGKGFVCSGNITNPTPSVGANYTANSFNSAPSPSTSSGSYILYRSGHISIEFYDLYYRISTTARDSSGDNDHDIYFGKSKFVGLELYSEYFKFVL